jgi:hypothetical protein
MPQSDGLETARGGLMTSAITFKVPHDLGKAEATRRIESGILKAKTALSPLLVLEETTRSGGVISLTIHSLGHVGIVTTSADDKCVVVVAEIPPFLMPLRATATRIAESWAAKLLRVRD